MGSTDPVSEPVGHVGFVHREARFIGGLVKSDGVIDVEVAQEVLKTSGKSGLDPERRVSWSANDEPGRHRETRPGELSQVRTLAAGIRHLSGGDLAEHSNRNDLGGHPDRDRGHSREARHSNRGWNPGHSPH